MAVRSPRLIAFGAAAGAMATAALMVLGAATSDNGLAQTTGPTPAAIGTPSADTPGTGNGLAAFYGQQVRWKGCSDGYQCTKVTVPIDYDDPGGATLELEVTRLRAAEDSRGSLLINPGGPGVSAVDYARSAQVMLTRELTDAFDVIGVDPRGVVRSDPVDCVDDSTMDALFAADGTPDSPQEVDAQATTSELIGVGCQSRSPEIAPHMDTESAARDMDIVRAVLGDERLNYLGKSYGSQLGAQYADLFPDRVGRVVLDGVLPGSLNSDEVSLGQAKAFDAALRQFVADCSTQEDCPLPRDVSSGVARIQEFIAGLDQTPLPGLGGRMLTQALGTSAIMSYLYFPPNDWSLLRFGLGAAFQGDGSVLMDMLDSRLSRDRDGTYADNSLEAFYAVSCLDRPAVGGVDHAAEVAEGWAAEAPVFGEFMAWGSQPCWQWPMGPGTAEAAGDPLVLRAEGSAPILVVSTKYDPATPYEWGVQVAGELDNATLLTYDGDGHTGYTSGSSCIDEAVDAYFLSGGLPATGTVCPPDVASPENEQ